MRRSKLKGHSIVYVNGEWLYEDTMTATAGNERPCGHCGKSNTKEGHDGCIGTLPGVMNACCGHGESGEAYIQYWDGSDIRGKAAISEIVKQHNGSAHWCERQRASMCSTLLVVTWYEL